MRVEIESVEAFHLHVETHGSLDNVVVQGVDLRCVSSLLLSTPVPGTVFLGCQMERGALDHVLAQGGVVFPRLEGLPFRPYRSRLYTADELLDGYCRGKTDSLLTDSCDGAIYRYVAALRQGDQPVPVMESLAQRLHDHAIDDALSDLLNDPSQPRRVVAIMGGHGMGRSDPRYGSVARIACSLTRTGFFITTGGGPGAMEAGNLGAWLAVHDDKTVDRVLEVLAAAPHCTSPGYLDLGLEARDLYPDGGESLAVPTWFYGHEPSNVFSTHIAKYFANSIREEGLLAIATHGVVYAPGSAGTIQEVFMDATQNHYGTFAVVSPMVFFGVRYWTETKPVYPLLRQLANGRQYADALAISDDADEIVDFVVSNPPVEYVG